MLYGAKKIRNGAKNVQYCDKMCGTVQKLCGRVQKMCGTVLKICSMVPKICGMVPQSPNPPIPQSPNLPIPLCPNPQILYSIEYYKSLGATHRRIDGHWLSVSLDSYPQPHPHPQQEQGQELCSIGHIGSIDNPRGTNHGMEKNCKNRQERQ